MGEVIVDYLQRPSKDTLKSNMIYMSTQDDGRPVVISSGFNPEGFRVLTCSCDHYIRKYWCKHIVHIYGDNFADRALPHEEAMMVDLFLKRPLMVPVVSSPELDGPLMYGVHVLWGGVQKVIGEFRSEDGEIIGYLRHASRATVRRLVLDWLPSKIYDCNPCKATTHTVGDSILDDTSIPADWHNLSEESQRKAIRDIWCLLDSSRCARCVEVSMMPF